MEEARKHYEDFVLLSKELKYPVTALELYRSRDIVEKAFGNLKKPTELQVNRYLPT